MQHKEFKSGAGFTVNSFRTAKEIKKRAKY